MKTQSFNQQKGVTLLIVLIGLLIITSIGALSVKQSRGDLNVASSSEARNLMFSSSDMAYAKFEAFSLKNKSRQTSTFLGQILAQQNEQEVVFCLRPLDDKFFNPAKYTILLENNALGVNQNGNCVVGTDADYTSKRGSVMTQVAGKLMPIDLENDPNAEPFEDAFEGNDPASSTEDESAKRFTVYTTTVMPVYALADNDAAISNCLKQKVNDDYKEDSTPIESVSDCLNQKGVPFNTQVHLYKASFKGKGPV